MEFDDQRPKGRIPPQDLEAEKSVLGALLLDPNESQEVLSSMKPEDFYRPAHAKVFEAVVNLFEKNEPVDEVTVASELQRLGSLEACGGRVFLAELSDRVPTAANAAHYAKIVKNRALTRKLIHVATTIAGSGYEETADVEQLLDHAESQIFEITSDRDKGGFTALKEIVQVAFGKIEELYEKKEAITGVATGFDKFDQMTAGFQPGDLVIVAGRPSMGKTALALNMAQYASVKKQVPTAIFSLEMSKEQLVMRMLCTEGRIRGDRMRGGFLKDSDWPKLARACGNLAEAPMYIDDTGALNILEMRTKCRRLQQQHGLGLIVVDYLQLMHGRGGGEGREREISEISRGLKALAKELHLPVVALSQLNRSLEQRADKRPMLSDLRESGAIEQDADVIVFVYRDEYYNEDSPDKGIAEVIIGKQRNGAVGTVKLKFFNEFVKFDNLAENAG